MPARQQRTRALVIGEHSGMRLLLRLILGGLVSDVQETSSTYLGDRGVWTLPHLVVVDLDTSLDCGLSAWHELLRNPTAATIPAVFLVEAGEEGLHRLATKAGATICLDKPFHPRHLRRIVQCLLGMEPVEDPTRASSTDWEQLLREMTGD